MNTTPSTRNLQEALHAFGGSDPLNFILSSSPLAHVADTLGAASAEPEAQSPTGNNQFSGEVSLQQELLLTGTITGELPNLLCGDASSPAPGNVLAPVQNLITEVTEGTHDLPLVSNVLGAIQGDPSSGGDGLAGLGDIAAPLQSLTSEVTSVVQSLPLLSNIVDASPGNPSSTGEGLPGLGEPLGLGSLAPVSDLIGSIGGGTDTPLGNISEPVTDLLNAVGGTLQTVAPQIGTTLGSLVDSVAATDLLDSGLAGVTTPIFNTANDAILDVHDTLEVLSHEAGVRFTVHGVTNLGETIGLGKIGEDNLLTDVLQTPQALLTGGDAVNVQEALTHVGDILQTAPSILKGLGADLSTGLSPTSVGNTVESLLNGGGVPGWGTGDYLVHLTAGERTDAPLLSLHPLSAQPDNPQYVDIGLIDIPQGGTQLLAANLLGPTPDGPAKSATLPAIDLFAGPASDKSIADIDLLASPSKDAGHPVDVGVLDSHPPTQLLVGDLGNGKLSGGLIGLLSGESSHDALTNVLEAPSAAPAAAVHDVVADVASLPVLGEVGDLLHGAGDTQHAPAHASSGGLGLI